MASSRWLVLPLFALFCGLVSAQPKPDLPPLQPGNAKYLRSLEGLGSPGTAVVCADAKGIVLASCEDGALYVWTREQGKDFLAAAKPRTPSRRTPGSSPRLPSAKPWRPPGAWTARCFSGDCPRKTPRGRSPQRPLSAPWPSLLTARGSPLGAMIKQSPCGRLLRENL